MRKFFLGLAAAATVLTAGAVSSRADAAGPAPAGLNKAIEEMAVVDKVHCVPGWRHHYPTRWRRATGCARYYRGYVASYPYAATYPYATFRFGGVHRHRFHRHHRVHRHVGVHRHFAGHRHGRIHRHRR
jgi:hypothetical protein